MVLHNHRLHPHSLLSAHPPGCILNAAAREKWGNHGASKCDSGALCAPNATLHSTVHNASKCDVAVAQGGQSGGVSTASIIKQERQNVHFPTGKGRRNTGWGAFFHPFLRFIFLFLRSVKEHPTVRRTKLLQSVPRFVVCVCVSCTVTRGNRVAWMPEPSRFK